MNTDSNHQTMQRQSGRWIKTLEGYKAFHPNPLPPVLNWTPQLVSSLADTSLLIGRLAGEGKRLPNPHVLIRLFVRREAVVPPPLDALGDHLASWERFLHNQMLPPLIHAALAHYQFEAIHPFLDGNGRMGRLLITLLLCERDLLPTPLLYLSAFFEATRVDYYEGLHNVIERADWEGWLLYFLNGVARQSEDALSRAERMNQILENWRAALAAKSNVRVALQILDLLASNPFITPRGAEKKLNLAYNTVRRALGLLQDKGMIVVSTHAKRDQVFCAKALLDILEEPARLLPTARSLSRDHRRESTP